MKLFYNFFKFIAFKFDPELVHHISLFLLSFFCKLGLIFKKEYKKPVSIMGIDFPNYLGIAAGLDKNALCVDAFSNLGFGFIEVGTVTPKPQSGNPKPRLFRLISDNAIINRMGFNNEGLEGLVRNLKKQKRNCIIGVNIGKNKDTTPENTINDYVTCFNAIYEYADYVAINISSPNTPGLREFGQSGELVNLLKELKKTQKEIEEKYNKYIPLALKISPDMTQEQIIGITKLVVEQKIDGIIATNTTITRENLKDITLAKEQGGLSGKPITKISTEVIKIIRETGGPTLPIMGVGGIFTKKDADEKIQAGANLLQVYTGFIYKGPKILDEVLG